MKFKTSSGVKSIVGKDLITDRYIAIFELVKNSYDARATEVVVSFNRGEDTQEGFGKIDKHGKIYIADNGCGMSKDDLQNKWLFLAYSEKKEGKAEELETKTDDAVRQLKNRVFVGSKGIGRFSSDRLGSVIRIITKVENEDFEHEIVVDWDEFDKNLKNKFEDIPVAYNTKNDLSRKDVSSYTIIEISNLREDWNEEMLNGVKEKLRRLKNPFIEDDDLFIYCGLDIYTLTEGFIGNSTHAITSNIAEVIKEKSINITAKIKGKNVEIILTDRGRTVYKIQSKDNDSLLRNVDEIEVSVNYLTTSAKSTFTRRMGIEPVNYGNIFIYRNGFHVSPYGEMNNDIFGLNIRKTQGYNRYLGTRELIGYISISDSKNYFKETSSRNNGFIQNGYFNALEEFYMEYIQRPLERYVQLINFGEIKETKEELNTSNIDISDNEKEKFIKYVVHKGFEVREFDENLDFESNKPEKIIERIKKVVEKPREQTNQEQIKQDAKKLEKQFKAIREENKVVSKAFERTQEKLEFVERQNLNLSRKRSEASYHDQITHHFTKLSKRLKDAVVLFEMIKLELPDSKLGKFNTALRKIVRTQYEFSALQELLTKTDVETRTNTALNWVDLFTWYFNEKKEENSKSNEESLKINVICDSDGTLKNWLIPKTYAIEVIILLENIYENAKDNEATYIDFIFEKDCLKIQNDSRSIPDNILNDIFDLGFTTKKNGTGIGLSQVKSFLKKHGMTISVKNLDNLVEFKVQRVK